MANQQIKEFVPLWSKLWLTLSSAICLWDAAFILLRPRTLAGGDLFPFWKPYELYIQVDTLYGNMEDEFIPLQSWFNLYEIALNVIALVLLLSSSASKNLTGTFIAVFASAFTFWKTLMYFQYGMPHALPPRDYVELLFIFIIPSAIWVVLPLATILTVTKRISAFILAAVKPTGKKNN